MVQSWLQTTEIERVLRRARLMVEEGGEEDVLGQLDGLVVEDAELQREVVYTRAWCHAHRWEWKEAFEQLSLLVDAGSIERGWEEASHTERERRAFYLVWLGTAAVNLSRYEDAGRLFTQCLDILRMRRVHLPRVRVKALIGQAMACIPAGLYGVAIELYGEALKVCAKERLGEELKRDCADIHYGLAEALRQVGDFGRARTHGRMALQMYEELADRYLVCRVYNVLGRIAFQLGEHEGAVELYMESLSLAALEGRVGMQMLNFIGMADVRLAEGRLDEARRFCEHALETAVHLQEDHHMCGLLYLVCGKVAFARGKEMVGEKKEEEEGGYWLQEARRMYEKAEEHLGQTQAGALHAEVFGRRAEVYEALNEPEEALACWKRAFAMRAVAQGSGWEE